MRRRLWLVPALLALSLVESLAYSPAALSAEAQAQQANPGGAELLIIINIPAFRLSLLKGDEVIRTYPVAVGKAANPSPTGEFTIINKVVNPTWYPEKRKPVPPGPDNPVGTRWLGLSSPGYGIHGTNAPPSIGTAASSGCIRMQKGAVEDLFDLVPIGTRVRIVYETIEVSKPRRAEADAGAALPAPGPCPPSLVEVHPDIYHRGTNTLARLEAEVREAGITGPLETGTAQLLLRSATGDPVGVPVVASAIVDGVQVSGGIWFDGTCAMLPVAEIGDLAGTPLVAAENGIAHYTGGETTVDVVRKGGQEYAPAWQVAWALGLAARWRPDAGRLVLERPSIMVDGEVVEAHALWRNGSFLVPLRRLALVTGERLSFEVALLRMDIAEGSLGPGDATFFGGDLYVQPELAAALLHLDFVPADGTGDGVAPLTFRAKEMERRDLSTTPPDDSQPVEPLLEELGDEI